jgi:hypothetical protein
MNNFYIVWKLSGATKIVFSDGGVECSKPDDSGLCDGVRIIVLLGVQFKEESVVLPLVDEEGLKFDIDPLVGRETINCFKNFCCVTEL